MSAGRGFVSETPIRVRYAETDAMGIVHHSAYLVWLEAGRSDWLRARGTSYREAFEARGYHLPVVELSIRYHTPAHYDDLLTVRTWVEDLRSRKIRFAYEVVGDDGRALADGETTHICTTSDGRVVAMPRPVRELLG